jgi:hypothetical protein
LNEYRKDPDHPNPPVYGSLVLEARNDLITYSRLEAGTDLNRCNLPSPLNAETRHHLLAQMLHIDDSQMAWAVQMNLTLPWENDQQFQSELGNQIESEETRLHETVEAFYARRLLSRSQMSSIRPKLSVTVFDDRRETQSASGTLPQLAVRDSRTTYRVSPGR